MPPNSSKLVDAIGSFRPSNTSSKLPHPGRSSARSCSANMLKSGRGAVNSQRNDADKSATLLQTVGVHFLQGFFNMKYGNIRKRGCYKTILVSEKTHLPVTLSYCCLYTQQSLEMSGEKHCEAGFPNANSEKKRNQLGEGLFLRFFPWQLTRRQDGWKVATQCIHGV